MQGENNLKMVQISFSSSTFERITEECGILNNIIKAKYVDQLADIGGTMGLLNGFSFISFSEILYFAIKILLELMKQRKVMKS